MTLPNPSHRAATIPVDSRRAVSDQPESFLDDAALLRLFLASRDVPCPVCGYNLRGSAGDGCPECGNAIRLHVIPSEARVPSFLTAVIGLSTAGGFGALLLGYFLYLLNAKENVQIGTEFIILVSCVVGVALPALTALIAYRRRFYRSSRRNRRALAILCWCLPLAALIAMITVEALI